MTIKAASTIYKYATIMEYLLRILANEVLKIGSKVYTNCYARPSNHQEKSGHDGHVCSVACRNFPLQYKITYK